MNEVFYVLNQKVKESTFSCFPLPPVMVLHSSYSAAPITRLKGYSVIFFKKYCFEKSEKIKFFTALQWINFEVTLNLCLFYACVCKEADGFGGLRAAENTSHIFPGPVMIGLLRLTSRKHHLLSNKRNTCYIAAKWPTLFTLSGRDWELTRSWNLLNTSRRKEEFGDQSLWDDQNMTQFFESTKSIDPQ